MNRAHLTTVVVVPCAVALGLAALAQLDGPARADSTPRPAGLMALEPVGSAFTYQGRLTDNAGSPLSGTYDFEFGLFAQSVGGQALAAAGRDDLEVNGGLFTLPLDFGQGMFRGEARYLEIGVREGFGAASFETLVPRQLVAAVPYALALPGFYTRPNVESPNVIGGHPANVVMDPVVGATVAGGGAEAQGHFVSASYCAIGGGSLNTCTGENGTVGGGHRNLARAGSAVVAGGWDNVADAYGGFVGGGSNNRLEGDRAVIAGGYSNATAGEFASVGGGDRNRAAARLATIAGGSHISVTGALASVGGGGTITVTGDYGAVGGGVANHIAPPAHGQWGSTAGTIGGGQANLVGSAHATVGGGGLNRAVGYASVVAGGGGYESYMSLLPQWPSAGNTAYGAWSTVGGGGRNTSGAEASTVAGGFGNEAVGEFATVGGGGPEPPEIVDPPRGNRATDAYCTVGGGSGNYAGGTETFPMDASFSTVGGGRQNQATWRAATVGGGESNTAAGVHATVPGGLGNEAAAERTLAAGTYARASYRGSFVWSDANDQPFAAAHENEFAVRATGGMRLVLAVDGNGTPTWVCSVTAGGAWACSSDRDLKQDLAAADGRDVLRRLDELTVYTWSAKGQPAEIRHIGPMAQDFHAAFGLGQDEVTISTIDLDGVALAAIQGLHDIARDQEARIDGMERELSGLEARVSALELASSAAAPTPWRGRIEMVLGGLVVGLALLARGAAAPGRGVIGR